MNTKTIIFTAVFAILALCVGQLNKSYEAGKTYASKLNMCKVETNGYFRAEIPEFIAIADKRIDLHLKSGVHRTLVKLGSAHQIKECLDF
mgnify:CR=1 FL=1